jgi:hypothetical protein
MTDIVAKFASKFKTFSAESILDKIQRSAVIAGGSMLHIVDDVEKVSDIDIFVLNGDVSAFKGLLTLLYELECEKQFYVVGRYDIPSKISIVTVKISGEEVSFQLILTNFKTPVEVIRSFDMDYVQVAYHDGIVYRTDENIRAVRDKTVHKFKLPLKEDRVYKALDKGYKIPVIYTQRKYGVSWMLVEYDKLKSYRAPGWRTGPGSPEFVPGAFGNPYAHLEAGDPESGDHTLDFSSLKLVGLKYIYDRDRAYPVISFVIRSDVTTMEFEVTAIPVKMNLDRVKTEGDVSCYLYRHRSQRQLHYPSAGPLRIFSKIRAKIIDSGIGKSPYVEEDLDMYSDGTALLGGFRFVGSTGVYNRTGRIVKFIDNPNALEIDYSGPLYEIVEEKQVHKELVKKPL